jgi:hypothetical protein
MLREAVLDTQVRADTSFRDTALPSIDMAILLFETMRQELEQRLARLQPLTPNGPHYRPISKPPKQPE